MKRSILIVLTVILLFSAINMPTAFAGSGSVSISGASSVSPGGSATYNITINVSSANTALATISCSGAFSGSSVNLSWQSSDAGANESGTMSGSITVTASATGGTGVISVSGSGGSIDEAYNVTQFSFAGSKSVSVPVPTSAPTSAPTATTKPTSAPTATTKPTTAPTATAKPVATTKNTATEKPTDTPVSATIEDVTPSPTVEKLLEWNDVLNIINDASSNNINISMGKNYIIPNSVLQSLKNSQKKLEVEFDGFYCTVDGSKLSDNISAFDSLDLGVSVGKDEELSAKFNNKDVYQLHFVHEGQMPGPIGFKILAEGKSAGDVLYLYYLYEQAGVIEAKQQVVVDEEGYVTVTIYHCSSYVLTDEILPDAINGGDSSIEKTTGENNLSTSLVDSNLDVKDVAISIDGGNMSISVIALLIIVIVTAGLSAGVVWWVINNPTRRKSRFK